MRRPSWANKCIYQMKNVPRHPQQRAGFTMLQPVKSAAELFFSSFSSGLLLSKCRREFQRSNHFCLFCLFCTVEQARVARVGGVEERGRVKSTMSIRCTRSVPARDRKASDNSRPLFVPAGLGGVVLLSVFPPLLPFLLLPEVSSVDTHCLPRRLS